VATPGRLMDHLNRRSVKLDTIATVVLDEADEMLNKGFKEDIDTILSSIPKQKKTWLFSATMPQEIETIIKNYMINPERIVVGNKNSAGANIQFNYCLVDSNIHYQAFKRLIDFHPEFYGIVFCRTRHDVRKLQEKLMHDNYAVDALHGDLSQRQREIVMQKLRSKKIRILIATDVAARGIDINGLTHVVHYHLPENQEHYTHRCGRTGRAGNTGISIALIHPREVRKIESIHRSIRQPITAMKIPSGFEVGKQYINSFMQKLTDFPIDEERIKPYVSVAESFVTHLSKEDLLKRVLALNAASLINGDAHDLTVTTEKHNRDYQSNHRRNSFFARRRQQRSRRF
jgi:ATP-dependent RNA helicase DeaD